MNNNLEPPVTAPFAATQRKKRCHYKGSSRTIFTIGINAMNLALFSTLCVILVLTATTKVSACSCQETYTIPQAVERSSMVFVGKVQGVVDDPLRPGVWSTRLSVERSYKGIDPSSKTVDLLAGDASAECTYTLGKEYIGTKWLFYVEQPKQKYFYNSATNTTEQSREKFYWVSPCSRTRLVEKADNDLDFFNNPEKQKDQQSEILTDYSILKTGVFANYSYPAAPILGNSVTGDRRKTFRIVNGVFKPRFDKDGYIDRTGAYLVKVEYVDVTGDGTKEAIAFILPLHQGNAVWYGVYVFSLSRSRPSKVLCSFATGDRGVGGLKKIYGQKGRLVVELWGWNSGPDSPPTSHVEAQAGSSYFTRRIYSWNRPRFKQLGKARIFKSD